MIGWWLLWGALFAWLIVWQTRRALREPLEHDQPTADEHDVGPDSLRLIQDLDAHLNAYVLDNPQMAAGFGRLRDAINQHREEDTP